jgi:hypothetical protein
VRRRFVVLEDVKCFPEGFEADERFVGVEPLPTKVSFMYRACA